MSGTADWHGRNTKYSLFELAFQGLLSNIYFISIKVSLGEFIYYTTVCHKLHVSIWTINLIKTNKQYIIILNLERSFKLLRTSYNINLGSRLL